MKLDKLVFALGLVLYVLMTGVLCIRNFDEFRYNPDFVVVGEGIWQKRPKFYFNHVVRQL